MQSTQQKTTNHPERRLVALAIAQQLKAYAQRCRLQEFHEVHELYKKKIDIFEEAPLPIDLDSILSDLATSITEFNYSRFKEILSRHAHLAKHLGILTYVIALTPFNLKARSFDNSSVPYSKEEYDNLIKMIRFLANQGANVDAHFHDKKETALMQAAANGETEIVRVLLESKANPNNRINNESSVIFAANRNHEEVVKLLIQHGARLGSYTIFPDLFIIAAYDHERYSDSPFKLSKEICKLLIDACDNPNATGPDKKTSLHNVVGFQRTNFIEALLECKEVILHGLNARDANGTTPLLQAISGNEATDRMLQVKIVRALLEAGAAVDIPDFTQEYTPLIMAAALGLPDVIPLLMEYKANINFQSSIDGFTAIMRAVFRGQIETATLLLSYNPDVSLKNHDGKTLNDIIDGSNFGEGFRRDKLSGDKSNEQIIKEFREVFKPKVLSTQKPQLTPSIANNRNSQFNYQAQDSKSIPDATAKPSL